ncbi:reticulon-1-like isoform X2 [Thalassophryne amazonica]|uniref:reticulon-1-like isoform X2 n=1 Tax=Thalassophryne amazonica TaxID=390379 RepID=UPI001471A31C|nr:reticulon-1-like isoform X2 [Thalassophryne amazonica]
MADSEEPQVSSTSLFDEEHEFPEPDPRSDLLQPKSDLFQMDDIVDLVGGAQDALERHIAEDSAPHEVPDPPEPQDRNLDSIPVPIQKPGVAGLDPDSSSALFAAPCVAPKAEEESSQISAEPQSAPARETDALPPAQPRTAAAAQQPAGPPPPPTSYAPFSSQALPQPLMQFPTALGQKGDSPAPISPLSPLHSPDSLEELSLTESPNQAPTSGSAAPFGTEPPAAHSKTMPWEGTEGDSGSGCSEHTEDLLDPLAGPYLSLGKNTGPHNPCEDSGVSVSPEEKLISSNKSSTGPSPVTPQMMMANESDLASSKPTEQWDSPFLSSQDNSKASMETFSKDPTPISSAYEPDLHGKQADEGGDLMYETKKSNPFEDFSPVADSGYSHFGDFKSDGMSAKMSESPNPDLVQYGQDNPLSFLDESKTFESAKLATDSLVQSGNQFLFGLKDDEEQEEEASARPSSLPDILKSSPLNPEKMDSGSSEGSLDEQSPILERQMMESPNPPINLSANNPFAFDAQVSLLKEMAEEMEVRAAEESKTEPDSSADTFDLVKEVKETSPSKIESEEPVQIEQQDWFSSHDSPKMVKTFEPLDFQNRKTPVEDSDSESPTADSLSPVLEAMAKNPASFQVEPEKRDLKMEVEEAEVAEEVSEPEVSSEEFEFIERPPKGVIDEFLEALDTSRFSSSKVLEIPMDEDLNFGQKDVAVAQTKVDPPSLIEEEAPSQSSYHILPQASPQKGKAELEQLEIQQPPPQVAVIHSPVCKAEEAMKKNVEGSKLFKMTNLKTKAVVDLLYWRDVKTTGVVFGASLLLLLSLTVCSIVSVCSYIGLALLSVTICFRIYKGILQAIQKSDEGHPFKQYLDQEVALSEDMVHKYSDKILEKLNKTISELRHLFLVEDLVDSIKFAVLMWILTYVGALFNGLTLLILGLIGVFSCPIIYEKHQAQIDHYLNLVNNQIKDIVGKIQAKVPGMKRKTE